MTALDNIKAALHRYYAAVDGVLATQAAEDPHAIALAIQEAEKSTRLLETWTQPDYIRELLAYVESLERDAARYRWLRDPSNANRDEWNSFGPYSSPQEIDAAIDAAMEQPK